MNDGLNLFADALVFVHGKSAASDAARHAVLCEKMGDFDAAAPWRQLQGAVRRLRVSTECANRRAA